MKRILLILTIFSFISCSNSNGIQDKLRSEMIGRWESIAFEVNRPTVNGSDSTAYSKVNEQDYTEKTGLKTTVVDFRPDGSYKEKYILANGELAYEQSGYWMIKNDSIILAIYYPLKSQAVQKYKIELEGNIGVFSSLMDYDGDGEEDDLFIGTSRRLR